MIRATSRTVAVLVTTLTISIGIPATAGARSISDVRAEAARIEQQIQENGDRIAALGEQYNGAVLRLQQLESDQARAAKQFRAAEAKARSMRASVVALAVRLYMSHGGGSVALESVDVTSVTDYTRKQQYTSSAATKDFEILDQLHRVQVDLTRRRASLDQSIGAATKQRDRLSATRKEIQSANATAQRLLSETKGELGRLIDAERQRQRAEQEAAAKARAAADARRRQSSQSLGRGPQGPDTPLPPAPPPSAGVAAVIAYARAQLGKPYVYATAGPDTFDCSGLTMMAWAQAGVSMPHYSGAQFDMFPHVALDQLQPGDLVFKGPGGSAHVALYVGGGMQIAATHTGSFVLLQPVDYSHLSGAVRP